VILLQAMTVVDDVTAESSKVVVDHVNELFAVFCMVLAS
jgi:hypothetical protein